MKKSVVFILIAVLLICALTVRGRAEEEHVSSLEEVVRSGFYVFADTIDISAFEIKPEELSRILGVIIKDDPYLFFVDTQMSYSYKPGGYVLSLKPCYIFEGEAAFLAWDKCRGRVREMAAEANRYLTQYKRAEFLHDYICLNFEYDDTLESDTIYEFLQSGKGTCQAYTQLYTAVLRECGIASYFVASDTIDHMWNYVEVDGEWYHADLTWDDSALVLDGVISHRHFLCSDKVAASRGHRDWYSSVDIVCNSERFALGEPLEGGALLGDADFDGRITLADVLVLRRWLQENKAVIPIDVGDLDQDGEVTYKDVELLRKKLLAAD